MRNRKAVITQADYDKGTLPGEPGTYRVMDNDGKVKKVITICGKGLTEQHQAKECDMNYILRDYQRTGLIRHANRHRGQYDDISVQDFKEAMNLVETAKKSFAELPANIRKRFNGDPAQFLEFVQNPNNKEEMKTLGMLPGNDGLDRKGEPTGAPTEKTVSQ